MRLLGRHRLSYQRRIRPRCEAPIASHIALGAVVNLLLENLSLVRRQITEPKLQREIYRLSHYLAEFKCFADGQVFAQFPPVTGFDALILARVYYGSAHPLTEAEIRALVQFEAKAEALGIARGDRAKLAEFIGKGLLQPFRMPTGPNLTSHRWTVPEGAVDLIERASRNLECLAQQLSGADSSDAKTDLEEDR